MGLPMEETLRADERDLDPDPVIEAYKKDIEKLMSLQEFAAQLRQAGRKPEEPQSQLSWL